MTPESLSLSISSVAPALKNHLWQSTLFALIAALVTLGLRRNHARVRYSLWLAASVKFVIPFSLLISLGGHLAATRPTPAPQATMYVAMEVVSQPFAHSLGAPAPMLQPTHLFPVVLAATWFLGFVGVLAIWAICWLRVSAILRAATPQNEGRELQMFRRMAAAADLRRPIKFLSSPSSFGPGVYGFFRPILIWPAALSERLDDAHLESVFAHEICHVRRRDNLFAAFHMLVEAIFWFHPVVWLLGRRLETERERACDEAVLALTDKPHIYAETILNICEFYTESLLPCVSGITGADLKKRISDILERQTVFRLGFAKIALITAAGIITIAVPILSGQASVMRLPIPSPILQNAISPSPSEHPSTTEVSAQANQPAATPSRRRTDLSDANPTMPGSTSQHDDAGSGEQKSHDAALATINFLVDQLEDAKRSLNETDARLSAFQRLHAEQLTGGESSLYMLDRLDSQLDKNQASIQALEQNKAVGEALLAQQLSSAADTPQQQLRAQLRGISTQIQAKRVQQEEIEHQIAGYQSRIQSPTDVDLQFRVLTRDYDTAMAFYNSLLTKLNQVNMATELEKRQQQTK